MGSATVLLIGSGGREHALAWQLARSSRVGRILVAPGNGGTASQSKCSNVPIDVLDIDALLELAETERVDLTMVGPEAPLVAGIVDRFESAGHRIFGPSAKAARLEGSKSFAKAFFTRHGIPSARSESFEELEAANAYLKTLDHPPVIKASGLAAGKGVIVCEDFDEARSSLREMLVNRRFGDAGAEVLIEERLEGPELSVLAFCAGETLRLMPAAQDHKRIGEGDRGPNTGGMGAFAPSPLASAPLISEIEETILRPTLAGMVAEGTPYTGVLYAGLMLTSEGPRVLEYNCRFGDPETQAILPLLQSDLYSILEAALDESLERVEISWTEGACVSVVMASAGYPESYSTGHPISGLDRLENANVHVFHAGTALDEDRTVSAGGRVLAVSAVDDTLDSAGGLAYSAISQIAFEGATFRRDIGPRRNPVSDSA